MTPRPNPRDLAASPFLAEHGASREAGDRIANRPKSLPSYLRWLKHAYAMEPPTKLHSGQDLGDDGDPAMTGEALRYLGFSGPDVERPTDWVAVACRTDGERYVTPLRCAIEVMARKSERKGKLARGLASHLYHYKDVTRSVEPPIADEDAPAVVLALLVELYNAYSTVPVRRPRHTEKSESQKSAEEDAA